MPCRTTSAIPSSMGMGSSEADKSGRRLGGQLDGRRVGRSRGRASSGPPHHLGRYRRCAGQRRARLRRLPNRRDECSVCSNPIAGLAISRMAFDYGMLALVFPLIAGFALIAPLFGLGLYEISRRRERGRETHWTDAFAVARSPNIGLDHGHGPDSAGDLRPMAFRGEPSLHRHAGTDAPVSAQAFARDALTTSQGLTMTIVGIGGGLPVRTGRPGDRRRVASDAARPHCRCRHRPSRLRSERCG